MPDFGLTVNVNGNPAIELATTVKVRMVPGTATAGVIVADVMVIASVVTVMENGADPLESVTVPVIVTVAALTSAPNSRSAATAIHRLIIATP
jgi:hypothetical protein